MEVPTLNGNATADLASTAPASRDQKMVAAAAAFLAFQGELMAGKILLPEFGGCAYVWCTTVLFFQLVLIAGYFASRSLAHASPTKRMTAFVVLGLSGGFVLLPKLPGFNWLPTELQPLAALIPFVGLSLALFTATPLLHQAQSNRSDFTIYAWSNAGALAGLISYPLVIEPFTTLTLQRWVWTLGGAAICIFALGLSARETDAEAPVRTPGKTRWQWWVLPAVSSATLLATTNQLSYEASAGPLTWALPLALFLGSYVWAFSADRMNRLKLLVALGLCAMLGQAFAPPRSWQLLVLLLIAGAMVMAICHMVLARTRSVDTHQFYLANAIGGATGSALMVLVVPRVFTDPIEFGILALGTLGLGALISGSLVSRLILTTLAVIAMGSINAVKSARLAGQIDHCRSLYACLRVIKSHERELYTLVSNTTIHGAEDRTHPEREMTYFGPNTGVGRAVAEKRQGGQSLQVGVVGLGAGTINRLLRPQDGIRYFEINPQVEAMARKHFTFLRTPETEVVIGDGRKGLEKEPEHQFDILVLDAFTGDAIPSHLLTVESGKVYRRCLKPDGMLAVHFTNSHVDLRPVIAGLARSMGMSMEIVRTEKIDWALLRPGALNGAERIIEWTDERSSILPVLK